MYLEISDNNFLLTFNLFILTAVIEVSILIIMFYNIPLLLILMLFSGDTKFHVFST